MGFSGGLIVGAKDDRHRIKLAYLSTFVIDNGSIWDRLLPLLEVARLSQHDRSEFLSRLGGLLLV